VRETVEKDGVEAGIAEHHLEHALCCRVLAKNRFDLFPYATEHLTVIIARYNPVKRT
jgi:hypothetical protein